MKTDAVIDEPKSQQVIPRGPAVCQQEGALSAVPRAPASKETDHNSDLRFALYAAYAKPGSSPQVHPVFGQTRLLGRAHAVNVLWLMSQTDAGV